MNKEINNISLKRSRFEIISTIIAIAQKPSTTTRLMYQSGLGYDSLRQYLKLMLDRGLIEQNKIVKGNKKHNYSLYYATGKGNRFLQLYCANLLLLHEEHSLNNGNLGDEHLLQYCMENRTILISNFPKIFNP